MDASGSTNLAFMPATELARRIRDKEVSPVELTRLFLERIERIDPKIGSYVTITAERALADAQAAEDALVAADTGRLGPLHGLPVAVKDLTATSGVRTTYGSRAFEHHVPTFDSPEIARVFSAGAILLGKTNTPELGLGMSTENEIFPPTCNPWDLSRSAGGSSGGSGAALAARLCPLATGTDAGGSVRVPAAACGVVGLKPSRGRVIPEPFSYAAIAGFATPGPMGNTVADVALLLDALSVPPHLRPASLGTRRHDPSSPLRVGWTVASAATSVSPDVAGTVEQVAIALERLGYGVTNVAPDVSNVFDVFMTMVRAHTAMTPIPDPSSLGANAREVFEEGVRLSATDYLRAEFARLDFHRRVMEWFRHYDVLLCPTLPETAPPLGDLNKTGQEQWDRLAQFGAFTYWVNMTGQPAISLPLGVSREGLPIGVQLVGRPHADEILLTLATQLEEAMPWKDRVLPIALA